MNLENTMLNKGNQSQKTTYYMKRLHLYEIYQIGQFMEIESTLMVFQGFVGRK